MVLSDRELLDIMLFIIDYASNIPHIPEDVYNLIQIFFNQICISKTESWNKMLISDYTNYSTLLKNMREMHEGLLNKLTKNLETPIDVPSENDKLAIERTNTILLKLCLMTNDLYRYGMRVVLADSESEQKVIVQEGHIISNIILLKEHIAQETILKHLITIFQDKKAHFYPNDDHFVQELCRFFKRDIELSGSNDYLLNKMK